MFRAFLNAHAVRRSARLAGLGLLALALQGCSVYYNTYFNADKAHDQALRLREKRLENNPEDTVTVSPEERAKLERAIAKSSKVLQLWPDHEKYAPKALLLMADSYLLMEEYELAAPKYAEFLRLYPNDSKVPIARVRLAKALYFDRKNLEARDMLARVLAENPQGDVRREAMLLSARMQVDADSDSAGLAVYERLLAEGAFTSPETRAEAHWQAALLARKLGRWESVRSHALEADLSTLPSRTQYRNRKLGIEALYELGRYDQGIDEATDMLKDKKFRTVRPELVLLQARGRDGKNQWEQAEPLYRRSIEMADGRGEVRSEAFYHLAQHFWEKEQREDSAQAYFDSSARAGTQYEFGRLAQTRADALGRILELRRPDTTGADSGRPAYRDFMMAEVFYFDLDRPDSARAHLQAIVSAPVEDSTYTRMALYALAYIEETAFGNQERAEALYRSVINRYPATEWAKQAEKNLGLPSTVRTDEDLAHSLFLEAERRRLAGEPAAAVIPRYREIVERFPSTRDAAKAQFVVAFLREQIATAPSGDPAAVEAAKQAYQEVVTRYPNTPYAAVAEAKVNATGDVPDPGASAPPAPGEEEEAEGGTAPSGRETLDPENEEDLY